MKKLIVLALYAILASQISAFAKGYPVFSILRKHTYKVAGGTGFVVRYRDKSYMITNWHVCRYITSAAARNDEKGLTVNSNVIQKFPDSDLCVMSTYQNDGIEIGKDVGPKRSVYAAGYPSYAKFIQLRSGYTLRLKNETLDFGGYDSCPSSYVYSEEVDPKTHRKDYSCDHTQLIMDTSMEGTNGNSGSPVVDSKGKLVGIVHSVQYGKVKDDHHDTMNYIPVSELVKVLDSLETKSP